MNKDQWLSRWIPLLAERADDTPILELGCGRGADTAILCQHDFKVIGIDMSPQAIKKAKKQIAGAQFYCQDVRAPFPTEVENYKVILASLSLHYFLWKETVDLIDRVYQALASDGILLFRVNSTDDFNYGSKGYPEIEPHYYLVKNQGKRFFDQQDINRLFQSRWNKLAMEEMTINRYWRAKVVWEVVLEKAANPST